MKGSVGVVRGLWAVTVSYVLFGAGYITYLTFLSAFLVERRAGAGEVALTWVLLGVAVLGSPWVWRRVIGRRWTVSVLLVVLAVAALVALAGAATESAVLFGVTLMQVPAAITARVRDAVPAELLTGAVGTFTVLFAVGQMVGPWPAGVIADLTTPGATLMWTAVLCAAGAVLAPWKPGKPSAW
ncbi:MAG: YbfB/YjiJ family MFS transporter [Nonomuraea sp.]|nr:YbfB/YjiJ family MFS transporter [Nonomuraea sp.]